MWAPYVGCADEALAAMAPLRASLTPAEGATVPVGTPITFAGRAAAPVMFVVASSPALLATPDIDSGLGSPQPGLVESYAFTSTKASVTPGTVYWEASFSAVGLKECTGPVIATTGPRTLIVLAPTASPAPAPPFAPPLAPPVQVSIGAPASVHLSNPTVRYRIRCTTSCSGETTYEVLAARAHARAVHVAKLDLRPDAASIAGEAGGAQQITHHYSGRSLMALKSIIRSDEVVELRISITVTGASGSVVNAYRSVRLQTY
jgi:hypothetical protein